MTVPRRTSAPAGDAARAVPTPLYDALVREYRHALRATPGDRSDESASAAAETGYIPPAVARWQRARRSGVNVPRQVTSDRVPAAAPLADGAAR